MSIANKIIIGLVIFIVFLLGVGSWDIRQNNIKSISLGNAAHAGIFDDISDAISGHYNDAVDRLKDDEVIDGRTIINQSSFTWSSDSIHYANGSVDIVKVNDKFYVQLNKDFNAGFAPDLYVYLTKGHIKSDSQFKNETMKLELGKLVKGSGASYYEVPSHLSKYATAVPFSVVIHCKRFDEPMGAAWF